MLVHGDGGPASHVRAAVVGTACPFCSGEFRTRVLLLRHLVHGAATCMEAARHLPLLPLEEVVRANEDDMQARAATRRRGVRDSAGLPFVRAPGMPADAG